ncbi:MAG: S26 family signal peptidase [Actinomycetota bacterium]
MDPGKTYHRGRRRRFALFGVVIVGALVWRARPFRAVVRGPSMAPALLDGDVVMAFAGARPAVGDVVVVEHPGRAGYEMVKRVAGAPGDALRELPGRLPAPVALGAGEWFVVGDAPDASTDSRSFGPVRDEHLRGVVRFVVWPRRRVGAVPRRR